MGFEVGFALRPVLVLGWVELDSLGLVYESYRGEKSVQVGKTLVRLKNKAGTGLS